MRYHITHTRTDTIKKTDSNKCCQGSEDIRRSYTAGGKQTSAAAVESSLAVPQKADTELPSDPPIPLLGINPREWKRASTQRPEHKRPRQDYS